MLYTADVVVLVVVVDASKRCHTTGSLYITSVTEVACFMALFGGIDSPSPPSSSPSNKKVFPQTAGDFNRTPDR